MNSWNREQVRGLYESQALGFIHQISPTRVNLNPPPLAHIIRSLVASDPTLDPHSPETLAKARALLPPPKPSRMKYTLPMFGYVAQWVSEVGSPGTLQGLLNHADGYMHPTWELGGLFYPRCDVPFDRDGNWTHVDPFTGNAAIGYARLNVPDGQHKMWEKPWAREEFDGRPFVDGVTFSEGVDFLRGQWVEEICAMVMTVKTWHGGRVRWVSLRFVDVGEKDLIDLYRIHPVIRNLRPGRYAIYINNELFEEKDIGEVGDITIVVEVDGQETDVVVQGYLGLSRGSEHGAPHLDS